MLTTSGGYRLVVEPSGDTLIGPWLVQWASPKTRIPYDFSFYVGRTGHIPKVIGGT